MVQAARPAHRTRLSDSMIYCPSPRTGGRITGHLALALELLLIGSMSLARPVYKDARLMVTKRVHGREFRLRPCKEINAIIRYVVAVVAERTGIRLACIVAMSNHWHLILSDPEGNICEFTRDCHALIARAINAEFGDFEGIWSSEQTSHVACVEPRDMVDKIAYAMANPVEAELVAHGKNWPGVRRAWPAKPLQVRRPEKFFRDENDGGTWPETAVLELSRPPGYDELSDDELAALINEAIEKREAKFRREVRSSGRTFLGRRGVLRQSRYGRPKSSERRFEISPRVACKNKWLRIERLQHDGEWRESYAQSLLRWRRGDRETEFPHGTYKMRVLHGAKCAPAPI